MQRFISYTIIIIVVVANQYKKDRKIFDKTARHWANVYANGKRILSSIRIKSFLLGPNAEPECDVAVANLVDMGFSPVIFFLKNKFSRQKIYFDYSQENARSALSTVHWNAGDALESLCKN